MKLVHCGLLLGLSLLLGACGQSPPLSQMDSSQQAGFDMSALSTVRHALHQTKLIPPGASAGGWAGFSVAIDGDTLVVGEPQIIGLSTVGTGRAHVYRYVNGAWTFEVTLTASDAAIGAFFGSSAGVSGDTIVIGAVAAGTEASARRGAVYVFVRRGHTWSQEAKLTADDVAPGDGFGYAVGISENKIIVGSPDEDSGAMSNNGAAYVFVRRGHTWSQQAKLTADDVATGDGFGYAVGISRNRVIVGALAEDSGATTDNGAAYLFTWQDRAWRQETKLLANDAASYDGFGQAVGISGNKVAVGAGHEDSGGLNDNGAAYLFIRRDQTWTQKAKLLAGDAASHDQFGQSIAISGDRVVVGAPGEDSGATTENGAAYLFTLQGRTWTAGAKLQETDAASGDFFGWSVGIGSHAVVGGALAANSGSLEDSGAAYAFTSSHD